MIIEGQGDLFGAVLRACARCGGKFMLQRRQARPEVYCSGECRTAAAKEQRRAFRQQQAKRTRAAAPTLACRTCDQALQEHRTAGRMPAFCSAECRRAGIAARVAARERARLSGSNTNGGNHGQGSADHAGK